MICDRAIIVLLIISLSLVQGSLLPKECTLQTGNRLQCNNVLPTTIPDGAEIVVLNDFPASVTITRYLFDGNGWNNITSLSIINEHLLDTKHFGERCFAGLTHLRELNVHAIRTNLYPGAFHGLDSVKLLNLANSTRMTNNALLSDVLAPQLFSNLEALILTRSGYEVGFDIDEAFWRQIENRPITY